MEKVELYRKYRPQVFDDVVGNESAIKGLKTELANGSHVFLFCGNAGCGKTTLARIVAKEVGATELSTHDINSSDNRGVDTARDIMEQMCFGSIDGGISVWILDECHLMTTTAQNAFLKALEDTPRHVYFILCTTNPEKLIQPLKTRCSIVNVKPLNDNDMKFLLKRTCRAEGKKLDNEVIEKIIELSEGGSRKALKLLSKVLYLENDEDKKKILNDYTDDNDDSDVINLCRALLNAKTSRKEAFELLKRVDTSEPERVRMAVMGYMNSVVLNSGNQRAINCLQAFGGDSTYNNGKCQLTIAILDFYDLM